MIKQTNKFTLLPSLAGCFVSPLTIKLSEDVRCIPWPSSIQALSFSLISGCWSWCWYQYLSWYFINCGPVWRVTSCLPSTHNSSLFLSRDKTLSPRLTGNVVHVINARLWPDIKVFAKISFVDELLSVNLSPVSRHLVIDPCHVGTEGRKYCF